MRPLIIRVLLLIIVAAVSSGFITSGDPGSNREYDLFKIGSSRDANEIIYAINFDQTGQPDKSEPIEIHWIKRTRNNRVEPLTWIQKKYAYGIRILNESNNDNELYFQFVSYNKRTFTLNKTSENSYKVFTVFENKQIEVTRIFIQIDGRRFWLPCAISLVVTQ
ncbi:MAG TPA: DUF4833 domain-containing protein [Bacteroidales bacterium]|nr:DUF4833 domain-containing protein [Bacteroidales bacterium]